MARKKNDFPDSFGYIVLLAIIMMPFLAFPPLANIVVFLIIAGFIIYIICKFVHVNKKKKFRVVYDNMKEYLYEIDHMTGQEFEEILIESILPANGFTKIKGTAYTGDYGVDIIAYKNGMKYAIQCKRFNDSVSNKAIQEVVAGKNHYGCSKSMVITNNYYTKNAKQLAMENGVELIDRNSLVMMMNNSENFRK